MFQKQIRDDSGNIAYWVSEKNAPDKKTIFFLHGLTADHTMFARQIPFFEDDYNIITWDAPAHGLSRPYRDFTYEKAAHGVRAILDAENVPKAILAGQSMGGFISQSFIRRYSERAEAFISIDSTPYGNVYYSRSDRWWLRQVGWMAELYPEKLLKSAMAKQVSRTAEAEANMRSMLAPYGKKELCRLMGIGFGGFLEDNADMAIPCPVLLICGEKDITGKVKTYNREWAKRTGHPIVWIRNAGHNANVDDPAAVNKAIRDFLEKLR